MTSPTLEREAKYLAGNPRFIVRTLDFGAGIKFAALGLDGKITWSRDHCAAQHFSRPDARSVYRAASDTGMMVTVEPAPSSL